jgi:aspartyl-tRNA(Asn)/glutamyl-tRNA(Gln) amidotransferase subunit A
VAAAETPARHWAETVLPASRAHPLPPCGEGPGAEPADGDAILAGFCPTVSAVSEAPSMAAETVPPAFLSVGGVLAAYRDGSLSPPDLLAALRARSAADGPAPEAVLWHIPEAAAAAEESAARWRAGTPRALEGVPFGVKDIIDVAGARVTCGSLHTGERVATADASCVARLRAAGAIPAFMLATSEYACGLPANKRYGTVPNPWDRTRWTGGSSTGSGAALAARLVPLALGTDTGGSIRIPAAFCGITGHKPTRGLVPRTGVATLSWTLDHVGPMARSAADIARALPIMAGPDGTDTLAAAHVPAIDLEGGIDGLRIGVPDGWFTERCDASVLAAWRGALAVLEAAGARLVPVTIPALDLAHEEAWLVLYAELASAQECRLDAMAAFDGGTQDRIMRGRAASATDYLRALRRRPAVQRAMLAAMDGVDVLVTPGAGAEAARLSDVSVKLDDSRVPLYEIAPRNTMIFDYTGFPALMVPAALGGEGLPVGIQIVGRPFADSLCLRVGHGFQMRTQFHLAGPR